MAYVDQNQSKEKTVSFVVTAVIVLGVGYAFVTGLAYNVVKDKLKDLNVIDVQDQPPPPPEPPPPPPDTPQPQTPPPVASPPPIVKSQAPPPPIATVQTMAPPPPRVIAPPAPPAPPAPAPEPSKASGAKPKGSFNSLMSTDDYPPSALRNEEQGTVGFKLDVTADGRVSNCTVTSSSGHADLDDTACKLLTRRARFTPAKDAAGNGVPDSYSSRFTWVVPKD